MSHRLERPRSPTERPIFPVATDGRVFAQWCEAMGFSAGARRVPRAEYAAWVRDPERRVDRLLVPEAPRIGEIPSLLARITREFPADLRAVRALDGLHAALDAGYRELVGRIAESSHPRALKRAAGRYRRLASALGLPAALPRGSVQTALAWHRPEGAESAETTVRLLDDRIARACLDAFFEIFLARAKSLLVSGAVNFTRLESDGVRQASPEAMFRCERGELSVCSVRLADLFALAPSDAVRSDAAVDRLLRTLVLEIAAYPWEAESDGANAGVAYMLAEKRMGCVGKSLLLHAFLDHAGIGHSALDMFDHAALVTAVPDARVYLDPTNFVSPVFLPMRPAAFGDFGYESLDIAQLPAPMRAVRAVPPSAGIVAQLLANIAVEYARRGQHRDALALLGSARSLLPGSASLLGLSGRIARLAGDPRAAREFLELAVQYCPQDVRSSRELAALLLSDGRYARAKMLYSGVAAREGAPAAAWYEYGVACAYDRDDDRAIDAFDRVLADDPDHARALDLRFRILRTVALERGCRAVSDH